MERFEFNGFLLRLAEKLSSNDVDKLKFLFKNIIPPAKSEKTKEAFHYFEELERMCLLSPTKFELLKSSFSTIGREDLVESLEENEGHFANLFQGRPKSVGDQIVCDGGQASQIPGGTSARINELQEKWKKEKEEKEAMDLKEEHSATYPTIPSGHADGEAAISGEQPDSAPSGHIEENRYKEPTMDAVECEPGVEAAVASADMTVHMETSDDVIADGDKDELASSENLATPLLHGTAASSSETEKKALQPGQQQDPYLQQGAKPKVKVPQPSNSLPAEQTDKGGAKTPQQGSVFSTSGKAAAPPVKEPTEDECAEEPFVAGAVHAEPAGTSASGSYLLPKYMGHHGPGPRPGHHGPGYSQAAGLPSSQEASLLNQQTQLSQLAAVLTGPGAVHSPVVQPTSYNKAGYSVVINPGAHFMSTQEEVGVVMMESGTSFHIEITNENEYAAEVDIDFGGKYLGVWLVEARLTNPLIIQGSAWELGRLTYYSATDRRGQQAYGDLAQQTGIIELKFKPEAWRLFAEHMHVKTAKCEVLVTKFHTAIVKDVKENIAGRLNRGISYLIKDGNIMDEQRPIREYNLRPEDTFQVLGTEEELFVACPDGSKISLKVNPRISAQQLMDEIKPKLNLPSSCQLKFNDVLDMRSMAKKFVASKKPTIHVEMELPAEIRVCLPDDREETVSINLYGTVRDLKEKLMELNICQQGAVLKFNGRELKVNDSDGVESRLVDVGLQNGSDIKVQPTETKRGPVTRGFDLSAISSYNSSDSRTRGIGEHVLGAGVSKLHGLEGIRAEPGSFGVKKSCLRGTPTGAGRFRGDEYESDQGFSGNIYGEISEGKAVLCGNEMFKYDVDDSDKRFSTEGLVTMTIRLVSRDGTATPPRPAVQQSLPTQPKAQGPMSTKYPTPVPD